MTLYNLESSYEFPPLLNWSPDGRQLLTGVASEEGERVMIVDLVDGWAVAVAENMAPAGWLKGP